MSAEGAPSAGSLADRISKPEPAAGRSWADEVNSPADANPPSIPEQPTTTTTTEANTANDQTDGAAEPFGGSKLQEPDYAVEVKLADMQADPNNPLYSVQTFEDLGL
jgi:ATP-dependent RNA helicase DDX19/DBP5